jgi:alkylglycerol monooxygenase|tara:strand:+ start:1227 stop:2462 length:1236 start_codon:yes stop_codon:yes gene_type:complete
MDYVPLAVPFFLLAIALEFIFGWVKNKNTYRLNDTVSSLFMGSLSTASKLVLIGVGGAVFYSIETYYALWRMNDSLAITWIFAFVAYDLCYYCFHRIGHERQIFWASHVAHHQSEEYNLSTALRQTSSSFLLNWIFYVPLFLIGVPAKVFVTVASVNLIYQFWVHSQHIPKLGWYELFFVSPSNHRVHHATNDLYIDKNYGGVFIIWDRMFGTFQEEQEDEPCVYGIRGPIRSFNPLWANTHIYLGIIKDFLRAEKLKDKFHVLIARTGWQPKDVAKKYPREKYDYATYIKFDPVVSKLISLYGFIQLIVLAIVGPLIIEYGSSNYILGVIYVGMLVFTMVSTSRWLEGRPAIYMEASRLLVFTVIGVMGLQYSSSSEAAIFLLIYIFINILALPLLGKVSNSHNNELQHG